ncbi:MAG: serine protease [Hylemonella sp.]|uniref:S1 family peptidase n=1 Tax=Hylemonella sp. TaxID=2066020 RepID=UPI003919F6E9
MEMEKFPLKFSAPAFFGAPPQPGSPVNVSNGSATLLRLDGKPYALTCSHVLEGYRQCLSQDGAVIFQFGSCKMDPLIQLKAEDKELDYALIELSDDQAKELISKGGAFDGKFFYEPSFWPPSAVEDGDFLAFGGFPGELRKVEAFDELSFGSYSSGATLVTSIRDDYLVCQFDRTHWVKHGHQTEPSTIRGLSGGPVFAIRHSSSGIMTHEFVGHVYEFSESWELLYVRRAQVINF